MMASKKIEKLIARIMVNGPWIGAIVIEGKEVADIVEFEDGVIVRWGSLQCGFVQIYLSLDAAKKVIESDGAAIRLALRPSAAFSRGAKDCAHDACENSPFASIGGLESRKSPKLPEYLNAEDHEDWLSGYESAALLAYGDDWRTCEFSWAPAVVLGGEEHEVDGGAS